MLGFREEAVGLGGKWPGNLKRSPMELFLKGFFPLGCRHHVFVKGWVGFSGAQGCEGLGVLLFGSLFSQGIVLPFG